MIDLIIATIIGASLGLSGAVVYDKTRKTNSKSKLEKEIANAKLKLQI